MRLFLIFLLCFPSTLLQACTVCGFGQDGSQWAFLLTTIVMTLIPLALFGAVVFYIYKKTKKISHENQ